MREILELLRPPRAQFSRTTQGGKALIYVWALEQKTSRRGWDEGDEQDVMVPWVMKVKKMVDATTSGRTKKCRKVTAQPIASQDSHSSVEVLEKEQDKAGDIPADKVFNRYYHLYRKGELEQDVQDAGGTVLESGYEKDNWWVIACVEPQTLHPDDTSLEE